METRWFRTLISRTDLSLLKKEFLSEKSKTGNNTDRLFSAQKHYFIETGAAEKLKGFFLEFEFTECARPKEKTKKLI